MKLSPEVIVLIFLLGAFAKLRKAAIKFFMSVLSVRPPGCTHGKTRLSLDGFLWNLIFYYFSKTSRKNSSFITIWQEYRTLYMNTNIIFLLYLAQFFLDWETFQINVVGKIQTHILYWATFFRKSCRLWDIVESCSRREGPHDNMTHSHFTLDTSEGKHTNRICNIYCFPTATFVPRKPLNITLKVHCLYC